MLGALAASLVPAGAQAASEEGSNPLFEQASATPAADQGSNPNYRSYITRVTPTVPGLQVQILQFSDRLQVYNHTGKTVTIYGYQGEPYARLLPDGAVQLNERSEALYLNTSFYGNVTVPAQAKDSDSPPEWTTVFRTGNFQWHDHRIHWAAPTLPPQVTNKSKRTLIFPWTVPISVGSEHGAIHGQLFWTPNTSSASATAYVVLAVIALVGVIFVIAVRRRRGGQSSAGADAAPSDAW